MKLENLAVSFHHIVVNLEAERIELFQKEKKHNEFKSRAISLDDRLNLARLADEIRALKEIKEGREIEKFEVGKDLLEELQNVGVKPNEHVPYHITGESYFDVWYLDNNEVCATIGKYTKVS